MMRTKQRSSQCRVPRASLLITLTTIILFSCPQQSLAQQWSTNGNDISNTNTGNVGVSTPSPGSKLDVNGRIQQTGTATDAGYLLTNGGLLANTTALNPGVAFYGGNGVNALYGADLVLLGVMKSVLGLELGQILGFAALSFLIMLSLEGVFLLLLFRGKRGEERTRTELMAGQTRKSLVRQKFRRCKNRYQA